MNEPQNFTVAVAFLNAAIIAERWKKQYFEHGRWKQTHSGDSGQVYEKLLIATTAEEVDAAIGNKTWTNFGCDACGQYVNRAVIIGNYDEKKICEPCLRGALKAIGAQESVGM
jgi:hypothetical protein